ncbi:MAG: alpha/beta hydrolase [Bacteroidetes bacterium]|nr:MAG: alpha/beta hydrolase [Bacteroidota bacterium]
MTPYPYPVRFHTLSGGARLAYVEAGSGPETLVLIHGLSSNLLIWRRNLAALADQVRVVAIDLPGYGQSPPAPLPLSMPYLASLVMELVFKLGLSRVTLGGHSMGGQIALTAALRYPQTVRRLVLAAPAGFERFDPLQAAVLRRSFRPEAIRRMSAYTLRQNLRLGFYRYPQEADFIISDRLELGRSEAFSDYLETVGQSIDAMLQGPVWSRLPDITQPVLVLFGQHDLLIPNRLFKPWGRPQRIAEAGVRRIPHAILQMVDRCGHFLPFEQAELFSHSVTRFMQVTQGFQA